MPLSASFHFFSPFHSKKKYHIELSLQSISSLFSYILLNSPYPHSSSPHILPSRWVSFIGYIRNLASIKYNKELEDIMWMSKIIKQLVV